MGEADVKKSLSQILQLLEDKAITPKSKLEHLNKILELSKQVDDVSKFVPVTSFLRCIRPFLVHYSKTMRTASLRILRYYLAKGPPGTAYIKDLLSLRIHYFFTRSLERDKHSEAERIQALKLVRAIMEADCSLMPPPIIQALIACAENQEDSFCRVCLETLCEIAIRNPQVVSLCNGMRILFDSILDPFYQGIQESLVVAILYLLNDQHTRIYIRPRTDLQIILSPLTNTFNMGPLKNTTKEKEKEKEKEDEINMKKWLACCKAIVTLLKSWTGILRFDFNEICLASDEQGLRSLVDALKMPYVDLHDKVLDALFEIFRVSQPKMTQNDPFRHHQNANVSVDTSITLDLPSRTRAMRHNLLNNYEICRLTSPKIAMLLLAFMDCGLIEGLIQLSSNLPRDSSETEKERSRIITQKSTILLGELLHLSNTLLPPSQCARLQTLPALVNRAISFSIDPRIRSRASTMVTNLHAYSHIKATSSFSDFYLSLIVTGANKWRRIKGKDRRLDKIDEVKMKMDWSLDDAQLLQKIKDSNVILTKDNMKWHWEIISELLSGALLNPAHLAKALSTKFIKRILSFLRPSNRLFSTMAWTADNLQYVRTACQVLELLVSQEIGCEYLRDNKFISSIAEMLRTEIEASLQETDPKQRPDRNRLLSSEKVLKTMSREYFTMLGTLSSTELGLGIMTRNRLFDHLKPMSELPQREDLCHLIMTSLDYNIAGESRAILAKALTSNSKVVRYLATRHMRVLLRAGVSMYFDWGVTLLVQQLNDVDLKVTGVALSVLDEACDESSCLEAVIKHNPPLLRHGKPGKNLMLRFLSSTNGLRLLKDMDFITNEMQLWKDEENVAYLQSIEASLSEALSPTIWRQREGADQSNYGVYLPPHFYGELTKNAEGCEILRQSGHFDHLLATAFDNAASPLLRRAALIAIGHIGSSPTGFSFLEESEAVFTIVNICETCSCLSIRGTCFYVLGMISRIERSREILDQSGWESPADLHACISVPKNIHTNSFLKVPLYEHCGSGPVPEAAGEGLDDIGKEVLGYVGKLSNHITADSASRNLKRMRAKNPEHFASAVMMHFVFQLMAGYKFRLGVRRFMYDCFDAAIFSEDLFSHWDSEPSARQN